MSYRFMVNQTFHTIAQTINYMYWAEQVIIHRSDMADLAYYLGTIEMTYTTFDNFCESLAKFTFNDNTKFMRVKGGNTVYLGNPDTGRVVPLILFISKHGVIENSIFVCSMDTPIPTGDILQVFYIQE